MRLWSNWNRHFFICLPLINKITIWKERKGEYEIDNVLDLLWDNHCDARSHIKRYEWDSMSKALPSWKSSPNKQMPSSWIEIIIGDPTSKCTLQELRLFWSALSPSIIIASRVPFYDLDSCMGHLLIGVNFFSLVKLLTWDSSSMMRFWFHAKIENIYFLLQLSLDINKIWLKLMQISNAIVWNFSIQNFEFHPVIFL